MESEIKILSIDDYDEILNLWAIAGLPIKPKGRDSREMMAIEFDNEYCCCFGLYKDEELIGLTLVNFDGRRGWINRLAVHPDHRGKGLAGRLLEKGEEFLYSVGARVICGLIEDLNFPSMSTFESAGYKAEKNIIYFAKRPSAEM